MLRDLVCRLFKVPPEPEPPPGDPPRIFRAARNFYYLRLIQRVIGQFFVFLVAVVATIGAIAIYRAGESAGAVVAFGAFAAVMWLVLLIELLIGYAVVSLDYDLRWYMVSNRALRIREGITTVKEKTIALANIQNISVRQGPLQRLLGISDVEVRTAGGSEPQAGKGNGAQAGEPMHVAYFRGVENAGEIRDLLRDSVRRYGDAGLGDPDDVVDVADERNAVEAARALLSEVRQLRESLAGSIR